MCVRMWVCVHVCLWVCVHVRMCVCTSVHMCRGYTMTLDVLLCHSLLILLRQGLSPPGSHFSQRGWKPSGPNILPVLPAL